MIVSSTMRVVVPGGSLRGELRPPPDKSITHRAVILSALSTGTSRIVHPLEADDCRRTAEAFRQLGVLVEMDGRNDWIVVGHGLYGLRETPEDMVYCGNSGTTMRLLSGVLAGQPFETKLMGDHSLSQRPMGRVVEPLTKMGATITARDGKFAPLHVHGRRPLRAVDWDSPVASAQVKSCVLLAGLYAEGVTTFKEPFRSRDHSERMLAAAGIKLSVGENTVSIMGGQSLRAQEWVVPSDISSAAFFIVGALLAPGSELMLRNVNVNPTRDGILEVLKDMGAKIKLEDQRSVGGEPIADILVSTSSLKGASFGAEIMPRLIDEIPIIAVAATQAEGVTEIRGAQELRVKESDRLALIAGQLNKMGARIEELPDGLRIEGPTPLRGVPVDSFTDHRLAMSFAIAGLVARGETTIQNADAVDISFPSFWSDFEKVRVESRPVKKPVVAIDGPAGAGKSTLARGLAEALGLTYVDTGAMYRAVAWKALHLGADLDDPDALSRLASRMRISFKKAAKGQRVFADGVDVTDAVRTPAVTQTASVVAAAPGVRRALVRRQKALGRDGGVVMEGRDIGTVVFPKADVKFFIDASVAERARRRYEEMKAKDAHVSLNAIAQAIRRRDHRDRNRKDSPLRPAADAHVVDTTRLSREQVLKKLLGWFPSEKSSWSRKGVSA